MAWTESHQELRQHPKTRRFARLLGVDRPAAVGWLHFLWWWAMDYAGDGDLSRFDDADIEDGLDWTGEEGALVNALTEAGFIDSDRQIHDWSEYGGKLVTARAAERERSRNRRLSNVRPADDQRATEGQPADGQPTSIGRGEERRVDEKREEETTLEETRGDDAACAAASPKPLRSAPLTPERQEQADVFHAQLMAIPKYQPSAGFLAKVVTKYGELDLEEEGMAIASYAKNRPKWVMSEAAIFTWLRRDLERLHGKPDERSKPNGRSNTAGRRNQAAADDDEYAEFAQFDGRTPADRAGPTAIAARSASDD